MKDIHAILAGLGGVDNIREIEPCVTRLRVEVEDPARVDAVAIRAAGAHGTVQRGKVVQVVVGPELDTLLSELSDETWRRADDA
ncbi:PTS transporter subunit EIIB [Georgenia phoenicis]|uniref:PTS transporter subunit EIIB n=1 Tax=unclassified Georgenia TaxID=2626815 RepID=UPI0039AF30C3